MKKIISTLILNILILFILAPEVLANSTTQKYQAKIFCKNNKVQILYQKINLSIKRAQQLIRLRIIIHNHRNKFIRTIRKAKKTICLNLVPTSTPDFDSYDPIAPDIKDTVIPNNTNDSNMPTFVSEIPTITIATSTISPIGPKFASPTSKPEIFLPQKFTLPQYIDNSKPLSQGPFIDNVTSSLFGNAKIDPLRPASAQSLNSGSGPTASAHTPWDISGGAALPDGKTFVTSGYYDEGGNANPENEIIEDTNSPTGFRIRQKNSLSSGNRAGTGKSIIADTDGSTYSFGYVYAVRPSSLAQSVAGAQFVPPTIPQINYAVIMKRDNKGYFTTWIKNSFAGDPDITNVAKFNGGYANSERYITSATPELLRANTDPGSLAIVGEYIAFSDPISTPSFPSVKFFYKRDLCSGQPCAKGITPEHVAGEENLKLKIDSSLQLKPFALQGFSSTPVEGTPASLTFDPDSQILWIALRNKTQNRAYDSVKGFRLIINGNSMSWSQPIVPYRSTFFKIVGLSIQKTSSNTETYDSSISKKLVVADAGIAQQLILYNLDANGIPTQKINTLGRFGGTAPSYQKEGEPNIEPRGLLGNINPPRDSDQSFVRFTDLKGIFSDEKGKIYVFGGVFNSWLRIFDVNLKAVANQQNHFFEDTLGSDPSDLAHVFNFRSEFKRETTGECPPEKNIEVQLQTTLGADFIPRDFTGNPIPLKQNRCNIGWEWIADTRDFAKYPEDLRNSYIYEGGTLVRRIENKLYVFLLPSDRRGVAVYRIDGNILVPTLYLGTAQARRDRFPDNMRSVICPPATGNVNNDFWCKDSITTFTDSSTKIKITATPFSHTYSNITVSDNGDIWLNQGNRILRLAVKGIDEFGSLIYPADLAQAQVFNLPKELQTSAGFSLIGAWYDSQKDSLILSMNDPFTIEKIEKCGQACGNKYASSYAGMFGNTLIRLDHILNTPGSLQADHWYDYSRVKFYNHININDNSFKMIYKAVANTPETESVRAIVPKGEYIFVAYQKTSVVSVISAIDGQLKGHLWVDSSLRGGKSYSDPVGGSWLDIPSSLNVSHNPATNGYQVAITNTLNGSNIVYSFNPD